MSKVIMIQGTMSNVGKSVVAAGLCRVFAQDGFRVAPFKSQNMALNSYVTDDGLEMGRAQVMQAEAAKIKPDVCMNPILLKPTGDMGSQVIVNGEVVGNMEAREYFRYKKNLVPNILDAFKKLEQTADIIVIEGAGSPAEINLKSDDIVNMGLAKMLGAPVLLVGDIDRGGVFAQLLGTLMLLEDDERELVKGLVINKFRGDASILESGIEMLEERANIPVSGIIPYTHLDLDDEDSLTERFSGAGAQSAKQNASGIIDVAVIRLPRISNFTDMNIFEHMPGVLLRYVDKAGNIGSPDMIILPGSKNTIEDMEWLNKSGISDVIKNAAKSETPVFGICGGYQMLGEEISDVDGMEHKGIIKGLGLLNIKTNITDKKIRRQVRGNINDVSGIFSGLSGLAYSGYEIHMGISVGGEGKAVINNGNVYGTYIHSIFDEGGIAREIVHALADKKGVKISGLADSEKAALSYAKIKEDEYDKLADIIRASVDMQAVYDMLTEAAV